MGWMILKQPNGRYARWSEVVDGFTHLNMSREKALTVAGHYAGAWNAPGKVERADRDELPDGSPGDGLSRWRDALNTLRDLGKDGELQKAEREGAAP